MGHYLLKDAPKTGTGDLLVSVQAVSPLRVLIFLKMSMMILKIYMTCEPLVIMK
jgi:hypothetical protein